MNLERNLESSEFYFPDETAIVEENREISFLEFNQTSLLS
jgi:hypothetical protein